MPGRFRNSVGDGPLGDSVVVPPDSTQPLATIDGTLQAPEVLVGQDVQPSPANATPESRVAGDWATEDGRAASVDRD